MVNKEEFNEYLKELTQEETKNNKYLTQEFIKSGNILLVMGIITFMISMLFFFVLGPASMIISFIGVGVSIFGGVKKTQTINAEKEISIKYKHKIIDYLLKDYKHEYDFKKFIEKEKFLPSKFIKETKFDHYSGEDYLSVNIPNNDGSASNCDLILSDLYIYELERYKDIDGNWKTRKVTLYDAMYGYIKFPFKFNCTMSINCKYPKKGLKKVELESIVFNDKVSMYCTDQVEARYIFTPIMMEKFLKLNKHINRINIVMDDDMMYIGGKYKKIFQLTGVKSGHIYEVFSKIYDDIKLILDIVEEIKNNDKVFKM